MIRVRAGIAIVLLGMASLTLRAQDGTTASIIAGEYKDVAEPENLLSFYFDGVKLIVESERLVPTELKAVSSTEFEATRGRVRYNFSGDALTISAGNDGEMQRFVRVGEPVRHVFHEYVRTEAMVPVRDGVKLHVVILKPSDITAALPFLIQRTPYGCDGTTRASFFSGRPELAREGYIYVCADIRGRYKSEGTFVMSRPLVADHKSPKSIDESTDTHDTIAWLLKNISGNNGRAGFIGTSYPGFLAMAAGIDPHPAVKAISPQAPMIDVWMGDDFFHNGAFRQSYGYDYVYRMERTKEQTTGTYGKDANGKAVDGYDYFLERGSFAEDVKRSGAGLLPSWKLFLEHPSYDSTWSSRGVEQWMKAVTVPTLTVGGYYDQEDMYGPEAEYAKLEPHDAKRENFLVLGPWRHGYWSSDARRLGNLEYGAPIGKEFRRDIEAKFFAFYLKDGKGFDLEDTASFQTGTNVWKRYKHFPPEEAKSTPLYLRSGGALSWKWAEGAEKTTYVSDPANPVPYRHRPIQPTYGDGSQWFNWLTEDQRFVADRKDVAVWKMPVTQDLTLTGEVIADIFAATTGTDGDFVVKLIDQYPEDDADAKMRGYQLMVNEEIFRGRYLEGFNKPQAIKADTLHEYKFSLRDVDHVFKAGHTVMVQVQSTWFPLYDRNPQTFVANIMKATPGDYKAATITIFSGPGHESKVWVPVVDGLK